MRSWSLIRYAWLTPDTVTWTKSLLLNLSPSGDPWQWSLHPCRLGSPLGGDTSPEAPFESQTPGPRGTASHWICTVEVLGISPFLWWALRWRIAELLRQGTEGNWYPFTAETLSRTDKGSCSLQCPELKAVAHFLQYFLALCPLVEGTNTHKQQAVASVPWPGELVWHSPRRCQRRCGLSPGPLGAALSQHGNHPAGSPASPAWLAHIPAGPPVPSQPCQKQRRQAEHKVHPKLPRLCLCQRTGQSRRKQRSTPQASCAQAPDPRWQLWAAAFPSRLPAVLGAMGPRDGAACPHSEPGPRRPWPGHAAAAGEGEVPEQQRSYYETEKKHEAGSILKRSGAAFSFTSGASTSFLLIGLGADEEYSDDTLHDWFIRSCTRSHWSHPQRLLNYLRFLELFSWHINWESRVELALSHTRMNYHSYKDGRSVKGKGRYLLCAFKQHSREALSSQQTYHVCLFPRVKNFWLRPFELPISLYWHCKNGLGSVLGGQLTSSILPIKEAQLPNVWHIHGDNFLQWTLVKALWRGSHQASYSQKNWIKAEMCFKMCYSGLPKWQLLLFI